MLTLKPRRDDREILQLLGSIKHLRVSGRENNVDETDRIGIKVKRGGGGVTITGRFDPARAPVVSGVFCSDNLGLIVYDIFRRKGIEPRHR